MKKYILIPLILSVTLFSCNSFVDEFDRFTQNLSDVNDLIEGQDLTNREPVTIRRSNYGHADFLILANNKAIPFETELIINLKTTNQSFLDSLEEPIKNVIKISEFPDYGTNQSYLYDITRINSNTFTAKVNVKNDISKFLAYFIFHGNHEINIKLNCEECIGEVNLKSENGTPKPFN